MDMDAARRAILKALSLRPDGHGYEELSVEGCSSSETQLLVRLLQHDGFVDAEFVRRDPGASRGSFQPSTLTAKGRSYLKSLTEPDETQGA